MHSHIKALFKSHTPISYFSLYQTLSEFSLSCRLVTKTEQSVHE